MNRSGFFITTKQLDQIAEENDRTKFVPFPNDVQDSMWAIRNHENSFWKRLKFLFTGRMQ
jgi:hypothetical protein